MSEIAKPGEVKPLEAGYPLKDVVTLIFNLYEIQCPSLMEHSRELASSCKRLAKNLGWSDEQADVAYLAGLLHDIGHLMAPGDINSWKGNGPPPKRHMETEHPDLGWKLLKGVKSLEPVMHAIRHHHEYYDGTGFPDRLEGEEIPILARLVAVPHYYQTLIRGYGSTAPLDEAEARELLREDAGILLDPVMVEVFSENLPPLGVDPSAG